MAEQMTPQEILQHFNNLAKDMGVEEGSFLNKDGMLNKLHIACPNCVSEDEDSDNVLNFNFTEQEFHCRECDEEYSVDDLHSHVAETMEKMVNKWMGSVVLLSVLKKTPKRDQEDE